MKVESVLDTLSSLVEKSLIIAEDRGGRMRYRMLDTVREYAGERAESVDEVAVTRQRHIRWFASFAERAIEGIRGPDHADWLDALDADHDNIRAALASAMGTSTAVEIAGWMSLYWDMRGRLTEARDWLGRSLMSPGNPSARMRALNGAGFLAREQGDYTVATTMHEEALAIARQLGGNQGVAAALSNLAAIADSQGEYPKARALLEEALEVDREVGDPQAIAMSIANLGIVVEAQGDLPTARSLMEEALELCRELGDIQGISISLSNLGTVARAQGDLQGARGFAEEALTIRREIGDRRGIAISLVNLGNIAVVERNVEHARSLFSEALAIARDLREMEGISHAFDGLANASAAERPRNCAMLFGAAEALREQVGVSLTRADADKRQRDVDSARALDPDTFDAAFAEGRAMALDDAIAFALGGEMDEG